MEGGGAVWGQGGGANGSLSALRGVTEAREGGGGYGGSGQGFGGLGGPSEGRGLRSVVSGRGLQVGLWPVGIIRS